MAKELLIGEGWAQHTARVQENYSILCDFIIFLNMNRKRYSEVRKLWNDVMLEGLGYLNALDDNYVEIIKYRGRREPKGFLLEKTTIGQIESQYQIYREKYNNKYSVFLSIGAFYEMLIYLWCMNNFSKDDIEYIEKKCMKDNWGFIKVE